MGFKAKMLGDVREVRDRAGIAHRITALRGPEVRSAVSRRADGIPLPLVAFVVHDDLNATRTGLFEPHRRRGRRRVVRTYSNQMLSTQKMTWFVWPMGAAQVPHPDHTPNPQKPKPCWVARLSKV